MPVITYFSELGGESCDRDCSNSLSFSFSFSLSGFPFFIRFDESNAKLGRQSEKSYKIQNDFKNNLTKINFITSISSNCKIYIMKWNFSNNFRTYRKITSSERIIDTIQKGLYYFPIYENIGYDINTLMHYTYPVIRSLFWHSEAW